MSLLSNTTKNLLEISRTIKNKTQDYSHMAVLKLEIKKSENEIEKNYIDIGKYVMEKFSAGESKLNLKDEKINSRIEKIKGL